MREPSPSAEDRLKLARRIYSRDGFHDEFIARLGQGMTAAETYYDLEEDHDDLFGEFKFPPLNAFHVWRSKRRRAKKSQKVEKSGQARRRILRGH